MATTEFKYFPFLPKELRDQIWGYAVRDTQVRLLRETGKALFFTLYNAHAYSAERPMVEERRQARPVDAEEMLHLDEDRRVLMENCWNYRLAAPRAGPWLQSTWEAMNGVVQPLEWMACRESRDMARRYLKDITEEDEFSYDHINGHYIEKPEDRDFPDKDIEEPQDEDVPDNAIEQFEDDYDWGIVIERSVPTKQRIQTIARFTFDGETRVLPITINRDLLVFQPLDMKTIDYANAFWDLEQFKTYNIALEFDPSWGYPSGSDKPRFGLVPLDAYGPDPEPRERSNIPHDIAPLELIAKAAADDNHQLWFIDYRIRLLDGAFVDEDHYHPDYFNTPRYIFRDSRYLYVQVWDDPYWKQDWIYCTPDDGVDVHQFVKQLASETRGGQSGVGVLACVPLDEVEELGSTGKYDLPSSSRTWFRGIVNRSDVSLQEAEDIGYEEDQDDQEVGGVEGVEGALQALQV